MATTIRLKKIGRKGQHTFRVVVTDKAKARDGKPLEEIGAYNPHTDELNIDVARADFWKEQGAVPSPRAKKLLKWAIDGIPVKPEKPKKKAEPKPESAEAPAEAEAETAEATADSGTETATAEAESPTEEASTDEASTEEAADSSESSDSEETKEE